MNQIYCGDLIFNDIKYKFDFRNNILVIIPDELKDYTWASLEELKENYAIGTAFKPFLRSINKKEIE